MQMELDKDRRIIYGLLLEEKLEAFFPSFRSQLHVYRVEDLLHVTRNDLSRIGVLSGPDIRRFEKVIGKVTKNAGLKGIFTKVLPKKQKLQSFEIPATVSLWEEFEPIIIKTEDLKLQEILGSGNFGEVYKGEWSRRMGGQENIIPVAVKCLKEESNQSFIKEVSVLSQLDQKHDNIIKLYGISIQGDIIRMVTEYAEEGSLLDKLQRGEILLISLLCQFAVQIASGMMYLEQKGLVHRDLAARNILVTAHNQVKISDFGLAKLVGKEDQWVMTAAEALPIRWVALESLVEGKFTSASDVWSFGVVLWELFSFGEFPWFGFNSREVIEKLKAGERLQEPDYCPSNFYSLIMKRCWVENPEERMKFEQARSCLVNIHPTTSFAVYSQQNSDRLKYTVGDIIIGIKPFQGASDLWIGQNERTLEFGKYIKSDTQPFQTKIPLLMTPALSANNEKLSTAASADVSNLERSLPVPVPKAAASHHKRLVEKLSLEGSSPTRSPPSATAYSAIREQPKPPPRKDVKKLSPEDLTSQRDSPISTLDSRSPQEEALYCTIDEVKKEITGRPNDGTPDPPNRIPVPDKLASGTFMRYPSMYVKMQGEEHGAVLGSAPIPQEQRTSSQTSAAIDERPTIPPRRDLYDASSQIKPGPFVKPRRTSSEFPYHSKREKRFSADMSQALGSEPTSKPRKISFEAPKHANREARPHFEPQASSVAVEPQNTSSSTSSELRTESSSQKLLAEKASSTTDDEGKQRKIGKLQNSSEAEILNLDRQFEVLAVRKKAEKPQKPPRSSQGFYFDDSFLDDTSPEYENTDVFSLDPSAWANEIPALQLQGKHTDPVRPRSLRSSGGSEGSHLSTLDQTSNMDGLLKLHIPKMKYGSAERMKRLRRTQSLESIGVDQMQEELVKRFDHEERARSKSTYHEGIPNYIDGSFDSESSENEAAFGSSVDNIAYKKLDSETRQTSAKRRTLFGLKLRKKNKKEHDSAKNAMPFEDLPQLITRVMKEMPGHSQPDVASALEISRFNVDDAVKFLKVKELVKMELCPQTTCLDMLKTYDWNVLEASYAIKIHYLMAIHLDLSMEKAAKLLRLNHWDIEFVLNELRIPSYIQESEEIGFNETEAKHTLASVGNDVEKALCELKVRRVADVTQQPTEYCTRTLEHCQWKVERAVNFILESS